MCFPAPQVVPNSAGVTLITICRILFPIHLALLVMFYLSKQWVSGTQHVLLLIFAALTFLPPITRGVDFCTVIMAIMMYAASSIYGMVHVIYYYGGEESLAASLAKLTPTYRDVALAAIWSQFVHSTIMLFLVLALFGALWRVWYSSEVTRHRNPLWDSSYTVVGPYDGGNGWDGNARNTGPTQRHDFASTRGQALGSDGDADVAAARAEFIRQTRQNMQNQNQGQAGSGGNGGSDANPQGQGFRLGDEL